MARNRILGYREQQVLTFVSGVIADRGVAPPYSMICRELGIATRGEVCRIVAKLERRGKLRRMGPQSVRHIGIGTLVLTIGDAAMG